MTDYVIMGGAASHKADSRMCGKCEAAKTEQRLWRNSLFQRSQHKEKPKMKVNRFNCYNTCAFVQHYAVDAKRWCELKSTLGQTFWADCYGVTERIWKSSQRVCQYETLTENYSDAK
ncbi:MAG: hypothetical protein ACE5LB_12490 [Acidiferrobacterales bacterium]